MNENFKVIELMEKKAINVKKQVKILSLFLLAIVVLIVSHSRPDGYFAIFILMGIWILYLYVRYFKKKNDVIAERLRYFIKSNNLIETRENIIINYARFGYKEDGKKITIRAYKMADAFSEKANKYDEQLQALFGIHLDNKIDDIRYCDYIFNKDKDKRLVVNSQDELLYNNSSILPLNNNLNWNILKQPHMLLAGTTGSGKTTMLNYLIIEFMKIRAEVYICDPKRSDLSSLKNFLGSDYVTSESNLIAKSCRVVKDIMTNRFIDYKENSEVFVYGNSYVDYNLRPVFLIFDELGAFRAGAEKKVFAETMSDLTEIILKGREMGVFVVLSTQQPNANNIPTELRDNLSVRLGLGNMSSEAYRMVFGSVEGLKTVSEIGAGYIFLDGLGWQMPKYFEAPYLDYQNFDFIEELKKYI